MDDGARPDPDELLLRIGFVRLLPAALKPLVCALFRPVVHPAGSVIVSEGSEADALYVLSSGTARVATDSGTVLEDLSPPAVFGEVGLLSGERRIATVRAVTEVGAYRLGRDAFEAVLQVHPEVADALTGQLRLSRLNTLLKDHPAFSVLSDHVLLDSLDDFELVDLAVDESITEDEENDDAALYLVERGSLQLSVLDGARFVERVVLYPGDFFGEASVLQGTPRLERVVAIEPSRLFRLDVAAFADLVGRDAEFRRRMAERSRLRDLGLTGADAPDRSRSPNAPLLVDIDVASRDEAVAEIVESEFFADLSARAAVLRRKVRAAETEPPRA